MKQNILTSQAIQQHLQPKAVPIAIATAEKAPVGIAPFKGEVPSSCSLWRRAEEGVFYASAEKHFNCPIGAMVMGFDMPEKVQQQLGGLVEKMCNCNYIEASEAKNIPTFARQKSGLIYGPLKDFPLEPDLIVFWLTPDKAMIFSEAAGSAQWTESMPSQAYGRPACAALPAALNQSRATMSLGCMGMRTFTQVGSEFVLSVLLGRKQAEFVRKLNSIVTANAEMKVFYEDHKAQFVV